MAICLGLTFVLLTFLVFVSGSALRTAQAPLLKHSGNDTSISTTLFAELEELSRIVDIAYCVGTAGLGIQKPFQCASRCGEFENFELVAVSQ
jgi:hypothetical protein